MKTYAVLDSFGETHTMHADKCEWDGPGEAAYFVRESDQALGDKLVLFATISGVVKVTEVRRATATTVVDSNAETDDSAAAKIRAEKRARRTPEQNRAMDEYFEFGTAAIDGDVRVLAEVPGSVEVYGGEVPD